MIKLNRSSKSGKFVSKKTAARKPKTTQTETVKQLTDKDKAIAGLYVIIEGVAHGTGMSINQIVAKVKRRFGV